MKVLLLLLLLDARPAEAKKTEAVVAPDDKAARIRGLWKLQMKELKGKGGSENRKKIQFDSILFQLSYDDL